MITTKIKLQGLYKVFNGSDCDNYPYYALLAVYGDFVGITEFLVEGGSHFDGIKKVELKESEDLFEKYGIIDYEKI